MIETLHQTGRRLEELTAGEVDTVADRDGRTFLLRRAQDHLRRNEATKQTAILNALPASIALLDQRGIIISVNDAWRRFAVAGALQGPQYGIGVNYLEICDRVRGEGASEACQAAEGIRSLLGEGARSFSMEYACHSPTEQRWFLMTVTPLADDRPHGAVVMRLDITAKRRADESLRASELRFREMAENIREVFWLTDPAKNRILYLSPAYEEIWGRSRESAYASPRDWIEAIHPGDRERVLHGVETQRAGEKYVEEYRIVRPDGTIRWIRDRAFPVLRDAGAVYRLAGVAEDITESRRVTEELRESERRFSELLGNVELVSVMVDREARITYCNEYLLRLTGWRREEVIGRNWFEVFIPSENAQFKKGFFAALLANQPETWHHENEILTRSGERRLIRWNNSVLRSGAGEVTGIAGIGEDITERKRAEEALRESEQKLRAIFEGVLDGILVADVQAGKFLAANPAMCSMLGYTQEEIVRIGVSDIHLKRDLPHVTEQLGKLLHGEIQMSADIRVMRKDGSVFYADIKAASICLGGKDCVLGIFRDITERKEAQDRIAYLNRVYAMLSGINTLIVRVCDRDQLFGEACRIAVEAGGFRMSLICIVDRSSMKVVPVGSAGKDAELLGTIKAILSSAEDAPKTMIARAIREKKVVVSNDSQSDPRVLFGKHYAMAEVRSMAILPLMVSGEAVGVLVLYAGESEFFHAGELKLLTELTGDIAFAIDHIEKKERLDYLAYYDVLTGLANRSLFLERVAQYMRSAAGGAHKLALFLIDLERFK
ncbi:MAG TPA: PAS domain S-box protein, partial [Burkholderiales bacterium]|nr:PAS domain S-box protein [Burkholderiales bacterium]